MDYGEAATLSVITPRVLSLLTAKRNLINCKAIRLVTLFTILLDFNAPETKAMVLELNTALSLMCWEGTPLMVLMWSAEMAPGE